MNKTIYGSLKQIAKDLHVSELSLWILVQQGVLRHKYSPYSKTIGVVRSEVKAFFAEHEEMFAELQGKCKENGNALVRWCREDEETFINN